MGPLASLLPGLLAAAVSTAPSPAVRAWEGTEDDRHLRRGPARRQPALRPLRGRPLQLPVHHAAGPDRPQGAPGVAHAQPRERAPARLRAARPRRPPVARGGQGQRRADVLREPLAEVRPGGLPRGVGHLRHRVQLSRLPPLDDVVAGGLRARPRCRRQRVDRGRQHRPRLRHAVAGRAHPAAGALGAGAGHDPLQPQRHPPSLLLVDERRRRGLGRLAARLPHGVHGHPRLHPGGHVAHRLVGRRPLAARQPPEGRGVALQPRQPRAVHGRLSPAHARGRRALGGPGGAPGEEDLELGGGRRGAGLAACALRQRQRAGRDPGRPLPQPGDLRLPRAAGDDPLPRALDAGTRDRRPFPRHARRRAQRLPTAAGRAVRRGPGHATVAGRPPARARRGARGRRRSPRPDARADAGPIASRLSIPPRATRWRSRTRRSGC